jgi:CheY-like chemotaxis protein
MGGCVRRRPLTAIRPCARGAGSRCDPESQSVHALRVVLHGAGFEVVGTRTASEALDRGALYRATAAIVELVLPDGDGVEVCRRLRASSAMPVIAPSTVSDEGEPGEASARDLEWRSSAAPPNGDAGDYEVLRILTTRHVMRYPLPAANVSALQTDDRHGSQQARRIPRQSAAACGDTGHPTSAPQGRSRALLPCGRPTPSRAQHESRDQAEHGHRYSQGDLIDGSRSHELLICATRSIGRQPPSHAPNRHHTMHHDPFGH